MKAKKKVKRTGDPLAGDRTPIGQLYRAVRRYVQSNGGSIVVIGGVQVQEWPQDRAGQFVIGVKCLGHRPTKTTT
jgi:hypothetical protein